MGVQSPAQRPGAQGGGGWPEANADLETTFFSHCWGGGGTEFLVSVVSQISTHRSTAGSRRKPQAYTVVGGTFPARILPPTPLTACVALGYRHAALRGSGSELAGECQGHAPRCRLAGGSESPQDKGSASRGAGKVEVTQRRPRREHSGSHTEPPLMRAHVRWLHPSSPTF